MNKWLYDILRDSTLVDNQVYQADNGIFKNSRLQDFQLNKEEKENGLTIKIMNRQFGHF